jgi:hypothetical protein
MLFCCATDRHGHMLTRVRVRVRECVDTVTVWTYIDIGEHCI